MARTSIRRIKMAEVYSSIREGLLSKLASTIGVTPEVAKSKATLIADSYASMRRYVDSDEKAKQMMIADSEKIFGIKLNSEMLDTALKYVGKFEGNIASDKYIANDRANFPKLEDQVAQQKVSRLDDYRVRHNFTSSGHNGGGYAGRTPSFGILKSNAGYVFGFPATGWGRTRLALGTVVLAALGYVYLNQARLSEMYDKYMGGKTAVVQQAETKQPKKVNYRWIFNQETDEHRQFRAGKIRYSDLSEDGKKWFSLQPSHVTSYKGKDLKSILLGVKVDGKWILGLNPTKSPDSKDKVQQVILYEPGENKLYIRSSVNYERKPSRIAKAEAPKAPKQQTLEAKVEAKAEDAGGIPFKQEHLTVPGARDTEGVSAVQPNQESDNEGGIPFKPEHLTVGGM